jgi:hypothetical protein
MDQISKRGRGRPPKHGEAMTGAERQLLYAKARSRDMAEVAYALKDVLARTKANQKAFSDIYQGTQSGDRLRLGQNVMLPHVGPRSLFGHLQARSFRAEFMTP